MLDGLADDGQLAVGDVSGILASGTETVVHILVASCEDGFYAVAFGPSEGFDGLYKVENAFHRVAKTAKISLSTNEAQLDAAFGKVGEVAAVAVAGGHVVEVRVFTGFLRGKLQHAGAVMTIGTTICQGAAQVVVFVGDVKQLPDGGFLSGLRAAETAVGNVDMHAAVAAAGAGNAERREVGVIHQPERLVMVADKLAGHDLGDTFRAGISAKGAIMLELEQVIGEVLENNVGEHFGVDGSVIKAAAFGFDFQPESFKRLAVRTVEMLIQLDKAVTGEVLVAGESKKA